METHEPIRILIVDDSRIFRGLLQAVLEQIPGVLVVGSVFSGEKALAFLDQNANVDLMTLDVEMPGIGGLGTLRELRKRNADRHLNRLRPVDAILISALTDSGSRTTVEGLQLGALDYILKPCLPDEQLNREQLRQSLTEKILTLRQRFARRYPLTAKGAVASSPTPSVKPSATRSFRAIAIGTSTGGPEALVHLLPPLVRGCHLPIFIVQHNLPGLSGFMAESLTRYCGRRVLEARDNILIESDGIYLAESSKHMVVRLRESRVCLGVTDGPPERGCRPAVDVFLRSAATVYGSSLMSVILTGMGDDGADGIRVAKRAGGYIMAQDEATSVVWGMPGAAVATGMVDEILPLTRIAERMIALATNGK